MVVFSSTATDLVNVSSGGGADTNALEDVFLWSGSYNGSAVTETTGIKRVSLTVGAAQATKAAVNGDPTGSSWGAISGDGSRIVFRSKLGQLDNPPLATDDDWDIYSYVVAIGPASLAAIAHTLPVSNTAGGARNISQHPISADGRFVAFDAFESTPVGFRNNEYVWDSSSSVASLVAPLSGATPVYGTASTPSAASMPLDVQTTISGDRSEERRVGKECA